VPLPRAPWIVGQAPVRIDEIEGSVHPEEEMACVNRTPSAATASMCGEVGRGLP